MQKGEVENEGTELLSNDFSLEEEESVTENTGTVDEHYTEDFDLEIDVEIPIEIIESAGIVLTPTTPIYLDLP